MIWDCCDIHFILSAGIARKEAADIERLLEKNKTTVIFVNKNIDSTDAAVVFKSVSKAVRAMI